ncbi:MAG: BlaI/MecI/CopY family transcriptional regulator [bacterium]
MARDKIPKPTEAELSILRVLWKDGPCTVRKVQDVLNASRETGYTTVLKFLQIMTEKGLVLRDESSRSHIYRARLTEEQTQKQLLRDLLNRAFGGSAQQLVMQALSVKKVSAEELEEIERMLDDLKG